MIVGFLFIVCFFLIIFQTTALANVPANHYDLLAPFIVYLSIHQQPRKAFPVILLGGLIMDGISGGVFGVYLTVYLWMYVGVLWAIQYLHVGNIILLPLLVTAGIIFESLVLAFCAVVLSSSAWSAEFVFSVLPGQILWGMITGPCLVLAFVFGQKTVERARKTVVADKDNLRTP